MAEIMLTPKGEGQEQKYILSYSDDGYKLSREGQEAEIIQLQIEDDLLTFRQEDLEKFAEDEDIIAERLLGVQEQVLVQKADGIEITSESTSTFGKPRYNPDEIYVENKPFSIKQFIDLINSNDLELSPNFQRNFIWDKTRQSRLIESIFLGLPLPSIYLSQYDDGILTVVDGLQRLTTIKNFVDNKLRLCNLEYLDACNGKTYGDLTTVLSPLQLRRFDQTQIMCFVIDYRSPSELKFDLFRRLNTGGKPLNPQEIRNCLSRPNLQKALQSMVSSKEFEDVTRGSIKDTRMQAQEIALRFLYFYGQYDKDNPIGDYDGNIEYQLDRLVDCLNRKSPEEIAVGVNKFKEAMRSAYHLFGSKAFRKPPRDGSARLQPINKLLLISISVLLAQVNFDDVSRVYLDGLLPQMNSLLEKNEDLNKAISYGTNSKWNIETAIKILRDQLLSDLFVTFR